PKRFLLYSGSLHIVLFCRAAQAEPLTRHALTMPPIVLAKTHKGQRAGLPSMVIHPLYPAMARRAQQTVMSEALLRAATLRVWAPAGSCSILPAYPTWLRPVSGSFPASPWVRPTRHDVRWDPGNKWT